MNPKIAVLATHQESRLKIDEVYNFMVEKITVAGGSYKVPELDILAQEVNLVGNTLGRYLRILVSIGLLVVDRSETQKRWRFATYRLPESESDVIPPPIPELEEREEQKTPQPPLTGGVHMACLFFWREK